MESLMEDPFGSPKKLNQSNDIFSDTQNAQDQPVIEKGDEKIDQPADEQMQ